MINPFETIILDKNEQSNIRRTLEREIEIIGGEIAIFESRILSVKRELDNIEGLIKINNFYKNKKQ
jgi:hypothetical protein